MTLIVDRTATQHAATTEQPLTDRAPPQRRRIDVSDLDLEAIEAFVETELDTDDVSLEQRGTRTYLVLESFESSSDRNT